MTTSSWSFILIGMALLNLGFINATPGRLGCFYDAQLCETNELCYNDSLFGTCVSALSDAVNYNSLEPEVLGEAAQVLQYLIETGYKWQDSYTQCVVGKFLLSAVQHQRYDPEVCEYLKALLDVIDQNKQRLDQSSPPATSGQVQIATDMSPMQITNAGPAHGEFMTSGDMATDFDQEPVIALPQDPTPQVTQMNAEDPATYTALQQYVRAYQQALAQQQPMQTDMVAVKKSDPAVVVIGNEATTPASTTPVVPADSFLASLNATGNNNQDDNLQAIRGLMSLVNSYPAYPISDNAAQQAQPETGVLFATADPVPQEQQMTIGIPFPVVEQFNPDNARQMMMMQQQQQPQQQSRQNYPMVEDVYYPDFSAIPPPEILQDMFMRSARAQLQSSPRISPADYMLAQELFGPPPMNGPYQQNAIDMNMIDPRLVDPRLLDPRMFQQQPPQFDPRMQMMDPRFQQFDPRMQFDGPRMMMDPSMFQQQQMFQQPPMDPRGYFGQGFGMNPNMMSSPPFMMEGRMDGPFMGPQMKRGGQDFMSMPPPMNFMPNGNMPPMMDPRIQAMYSRPPYGFFPQEVALPFSQQDWRPPMSLPEGFVFAEQGFPAIEAPVNDSANGRTFNVMLGETEEQTGNGASGPTVQNKKDQEYRSLLPSDESQDNGATEDVTVTVVKGSVNKPIPSGEDSGANTPDDDYVFLITDPELDNEQGRFLLNWLAAVMGMPQQTFYDLNVNDDLLTFRVNPAIDRLNATFVAQTLGGDDLRAGLRRTNNLRLLRAGVGRYALDDSAGLDVPQLTFQQTAIVQSESDAAAEAAIVQKYDVVDPTFAFVVTEPALTYDKARRMLNWLAIKLHVPQTIFSSLHIEDHQLLFRVSPYFSQINASGVVDRLSDSSIQAGLRQEFQVEIIRSGIGDRVQIIKADNKQRQTLFFGLIAVACVAAVLISLGIIYLVRRNMIMRKKLHGLGGDVESSKEYEELCRQRMACKNLEGGIIVSPDHKIVHERTTHSSTSSWSEEPAPTNMDITTGHMVLSYMEDHLKHKERMNEEWASLCNYEADPSATIAGSQVENLIKNRCPDVLPYDHTRVHLNSAINSTKSDYVNANLITDADPKHAVYIATQGPLPETVTDFWQMVWESNSTIIVMLSKLRENEQDLCHIYWPKEGSECYSIYEVHLVSEHIWCDDYLVRNFYLKNLQTNETRTVTQFHYLNWPNLGVPSSLKTFLEFRRKINKCYKGGSSPIVVHCSDGVDRTGAYCLIDLVLNRMAKGVKEIDIAATLEHLRDQRMGMVRTKEQFEFVLTAVALEIQAILKSMPQK